MMEIVSSVVGINNSLFYLINLGMENPLFNFLMPIITDLGSILFWLVICGFLFLFGREKGKKVAILCLFALLISFSLTVVLKYAVAEPRPFLVLNNINLLHLEGNYSFPSSHTVTAFAGGLIIGKKYGYLIILMALAVLIGFSRIYIGVHYPLDVVFGAVLGISCALITLRFENEILHNRFTDLIVENRITGKLG
jgi:undecaprenyl-diphosphatase